MNEQGDWHPDSAGDWAQSKCGRTVMYHIVLPVTKIEALGLILANPLENDAFLQLRNLLSC